MKKSGDSKPLRVVSLEMEMDPEKLGDALPVPLLGRRFFSRFFLGGFSLRSAKASDGIVPGGRSSTGIFCIISPSWFLMLTTIG